MHSSRESLFSGNFNHHCPLRKPESAGFKSDQNLAAASRPSPSPYFLPSPSLHLSLLFSNLSIPCIAAHQLPLLPLLLLESSLVTVGHFKRGQPGAGKAMETLELRLCWISWHWGALEVQIPARSGGLWWHWLWAQGGKGCAAQESGAPESCFTWGCWQGALRELLCVEELWRKHFEELQIGCLWGAHECDIKASS